MSVDVEKRVTDAHVGVLQHIGIIPDGNRRWAKERGLPTAAGFRAGAERIPGVLGWCAERNIEFISLWMMSESNLHRSLAEVSMMLTLAEEVVERLGELGHWRLHVIGRLDLVPERTASALRKVVRATEDVQGPDVNLAIGYTGRDDITSAVRSFLRSPDLRRRDGGRIADELTMERLRGFLSTGDQPDPDLVIRTSGEERLSGFMTWQTAESELYFCPKMWPDFSEADLDSAIASYRNRDRRYGL